MEAVHGVLGVSLLGLPNHIAGPTVTEHKHLAMRPWDQCLIESARAAAQGQEALDTERAGEGCGAHGCRRGPGGE